MTLRGTWDRARTPAGHRALIVASVLALAWPSAAAVADDGADVATDRLDGEHRYETAAEIATATDLDAGVILASGEDFADALVASYGVGGTTSHVLLTEHDELPEATDAALEALDPGSVTVVGGEAAVSESVLDEVRAEHDPDAGVFRVHGEDRYETAASMLEGPDGPQIGTVDGQRTALLASGEDFADALAAGPIAAAEDLPLLLTTSEPTEATTTAADAVEGQRHDVGIEQVIIVGGPEAIDEDVAAYLEDERGLAVDRWYGETRTETAAAVADQAIDRFGFDPTTTLLARGDDFADALAAAPYAASEGAPLLLSEEPGHLGHAGQWLADRCDDIAAISALGGPAAVTEHALDVARDTVDRCAVAITPVDELALEDLPRDEADQRQHLSFGLSRDPRPELDTVNVDLATAIDDELVTYDADAQVEVVQGDGEAELDLEPLGVGRAPGVVYTAGADDAAGDTVELEIVEGVSTADVDASTLARIHPDGARATFDIGDGGPVAPELGPVVADDDAYEQRVRLRPVEELDADEELTVDLGEPERGPVDYADAAATVERGDAEATLEVDPGEGAVLTVSVGEAGAAPGEALEASLAPVAGGAADANERLTAEVTRVATGEAQTARLWFGHPPFH